MKYVYILQKDGGVKAFVSFQRAKAFVDSYYKKCQGHTLDWVRHRAGLHDIIVTYNQIHVNTITLQRLEIQ